MALQRFSPLGTNRPHIHLLRYSKSRQWMASMCNHHAIGNTPEDAYVSLYRYLRGKPGMSYALAEGVRRQESFINRMRNP